ncbi:MAG: tRNA (adenosine(37)-N6)-threonylcarbamoyltransferase complex dimerization subunit type 1 TsaB [Candidatus Competibacteraceae bacterium]
MKLLALDTSTEACSAAAMVDDEVIERYELAPRRHAALILPMIEAVLAEAGLTAGQLDAVAFGRGPGAFTGIRIGVGVAQGIAFAADLPVAPISTLAAVAYNAYSERNASHIAVALDARMGEVYWATYSATAEGGVTLLGAEQVCSPIAVPGLNGADWLGAGTGWTVYNEILAQRLGTLTWWGDCYPRAGDIALLGAVAGQRGQWVDAEQALPVYLRDEVASKS